MQVDPIKPKLKPPGTKRLKPKRDMLLSTSAVKFNLRRYVEASTDTTTDDTAVSGAAAAATMAFTARPHTPPPVASQPEPFSSLKQPIRVSHKK